MASCPVCDESECWHCWECGADLSAEVHSADCGSRPEAQARKDLAAAVSCCATCGGTSSGKPCVPCERREMMEWLRKPVEKVDASSLLK